MLDKAQALEITETALKCSPADQTEVVLMGDQLWLTRVAESVIHQNMALEETRLVVTTVKDKKVGLASTNDLSPAGITAVVGSANQISMLQKPDDRFVSFPDKALAPPLTKTIAVEPNTKFSPAEMADAVAKVAQKAAQSGGLTTAGALRHEIHAVAVANSLGVRQYGRFGRAELSLTVTGEGESSGFAIGFNPDPAKIDFALLTQQAIDRAKGNINPVSLPDGQYTVILEPAAVGQLLLFVGFMGFGGMRFMQKRSFLSGKKGEMITGDKITITDEPDNPAYGNLPFDYEGIPVQHLTMIDHGKAGDAAFDSYYANAMGVKPTGHALPPDNSYGPYPKNMVMAGGDSSLSEMIGSTEKGVLITHFWYVNFLNPMQTMITGTTRDGTFMIENGRVGSAIKNMRTNQSILEALSNVQMISRERVVYPQYSSLMLVPSLKIGGFNLIQETKEAWEGKC